MAFCTTCGARIQGKYCTQCGSAQAQSDGSASPLPKIAPGSMSSWSPRAKRNLVMILAAAGVGVLALGLLATYEARGGEAYQFASKFWGERLTDCGGSYYIRHNLGASATLYQYQSPSVWVRADEVSEADRLNGFQWVGWTGISTSSWRFKLGSSHVGGPPTFGPGWSDWAAGTPQDASFRMWKSKGQWHVDTRGSFGTSRIPTAVDCSWVK